MLLTITTTYTPTTDLGYLLHKNPAHVQAFDYPFGVAHVFYPEVSAERCTAALLLGNYFDNVTLHISSKTCCMIPRKSPSIHRRIGFASR